MALGLALASVPGTVVFVAPLQAQEFTFTSVSVQGNQRISDATILDYLGVRRGQPISAAALNDGYQRLLASGLFEEAAIRPANNALVVTVREYPTINRISIEGNRRLSTADALALVQSTPRRVYNPEQALADAAAIAARYRAQGRFAATVTPKIIRRSDNRVDLVFEVLEGRVTENERISFVGNDSFSDRRLRRVLSTKQAGVLRAFIQRDIFVPQRLELDRQLLRDFYLSRGYIDVEVTAGVAELTRERDAFLITFTLREGQAYRFGQTQVSTDLPGIEIAAYEAQMRLRSGATYSPVDVQNQVQRLEELATRQGLAFVRAEPRIRRNDAERTLDIDFVLVRGPRLFVERIDIEGNATTLDRVIRSQFRIVEGDPFNPRQIAEAAERIRALGFFTDVDVEARQGSAPDQLIVDVGVEEGPTGSLSFGLSYSASSGAGAAVSFSETNFLGRGQTISGSLTTGVAFRNIELSFREPRLLGREVGAGISAFLRTTEAREERFDTESLGILPTVDFPVSRNGRLALRYRLSREQLINVTSASPIVTGDAGAAITSALGYTYSFDTRRTGFDPRSGVLLRFGQDLAGLGGDTRYLRSTALVGAETAVFNEEVTLRVEFEGGAIVPLGGTQSRMTDRFFMNAGEIRGFRRNGLGPRDLVSGTDDALGGNYFAVARFEAEFPIGLPEEYGISGGLFFDVGTVWGLNNTLGGAVDDSMRWRSTVGFSVFWSTPIGPLRLNFSRPVTTQPYDRTQNFDLTISTRF